MLNAHIYFRDDLSANDFYFDAFCAKHGLSWSCCLTA